jgi:hypothetical protein
LVSVRYFSNEEATLWQFKVFGKQCLRIYKDFILLVGDFPKPQEQPTSGLAAHSVPERFSAAPVQV